MASLWILAIILFIILVLFIAWMALSSCLGDNFRNQITNAFSNPRQAIYDHRYMRTVTSSGQGNWNQIEMDDMLGDNLDSSNLSGRDW